VASLAAALRRRFPDVAVTSHPVRFEAANAAVLLRGYDVIVDGSDNFATKFVANDAAVLAGVVLVHGAAVGTGGQLLRPRRRTSCYRCLFEELPPDGVGPSCAEAGVMGPVPGVIGALQGAEAARLCRGETPAFIGRLIQYDSLAMMVRAVASNPIRCVACAARIRRSVGWIQPNTRQPDVRPRPRSRGAKRSSMSTASTGATASIPARRRRSSGLRCRECGNQIPKAPVTSASSASVRSR